MDPGASWRAPRESGQLATALAQRDRLVIWLDASIALPMLCGKLDRVADGWATSEIAVELHEALLERGISTSACAARSSARWRGISSDTASASTG